MRFRNKVVLITGGSSGIGKATARLFLLEGAKVVVADKNIIDVSGGSLFHKNKFLYNLKIDISKEEEVIKMVDLTIKRLGRIDILFNNAGIYNKKSTLLLSSEEWSDILTTNLTGLFLCCKYIIAHMITRKKGVIINMSSTEALSGEEKSSAYCASKGGVISLTKSLAREFAPFGIRINCIVPGSIITPMFKKWNTLQDIAHIGRNAPLKKLGKPDDVARGVLYLASEENGFITGQMLIIDGGVL